MFDLVAGRARASVAPDCGAALAGLWHDGRPVLRPLAPGAGADPFAYALNILAPFSNRISGGFDFAGRHHALAPNLPGEACPIHGDAFQRPWRIDHATDAAATLVLDQGRFGPFHYAARLALSLTDGGLSAVLTLRNEGAAPLPFGAGFHPWFPRDSDTRIAFAASSWWPEDARHLPATRAPVDLPDSLRFDAPRPLPDGWINAGFSGWGGQARILQGPAFVSLTLRADGLPLALLYSPGRDAPFFCFEPVSHPVDAHNLPGLPGLVTLAPGQEMTCALTLTWA